MLLCCQISKHLALGSLLVSSAPTLTSLPLPSPPPPSAEEVRLLGEGTLPSLISNDLAPANLAFLGFQDHLPPSSGSSLIIRARMMLFPGAPHQVDVRAGCDISSDPFTPSSVPADGQQLHSNTPPAGKDCQVSYDGPQGSYLQERMLYPCSYPQPESQSHSESLEIELPSRDSLT